MFDIFKKLDWFFKLRAKTYGLAVVCLLVVSLASAVTPIIIGNLIDALAERTLVASDIYLQIGIIFGLGVLMYALRYAWRALIFTNSTMLEAIMRNKLFDHFTKMDSEFFHEHRTGDLMAHATNDLASLKFVAGGGILTLTDSIVVSATTLFSMFVFIDWQLTLLTIVPFPLLIVISRKLGKVINTRFRKSLESFSRVNDHVQESVSGIRVIKAFGEEQDDYASYSEDIEHVVEMNKQVFKIDSLYRPAIDSITSLSYLLALIFGTYFIYNGRITIGNLVSYFSYLAMMTWPLLAVGFLANTLERGNVSYDRIQELLNNKSNIKEAQNPVREPIKGDIHFDVRSFQYEDDEAVLLEDVQFELKAGQTLGLVGKTGSGKSTIFKLLMRDYDHYKGQITYGGIDIKDYAVDSVAEAIGYVAQEPFLFSHSIAENIRFGNPSLSLDQVAEFAKLSDVYEDIMGFPEQFDTQVGEKGVALSGGQKQRISIARALAVEPDYLFLDDSLSAVDAQTEHKILANLRELRQNRTTIIASHKISSVMGADLILVMEQGRVIGKGTHDDLIGSNEWYSKMYQKQQLEEKVEGGDQYGA